MLIFCKFKRDLKIKATEMIKTLDHVLYEEQLREQELFSLDVRRAQGGEIDVHVQTYLREGAKKMESDPFWFPVMGQGDKLKCRKLCLNIRSTGKVFKRHCRVSLFADIQNLSRHGLFHGSAIL